MSDNNHELEISRTYVASPETIFDAWLSADSIRQWMCPGEGVTVPNPVLDAKVGGAFDFTMKVGEEIIPHTGQFKIIDRPRKLQFTWVSPHTGGLDSIVTIRLEKVGDNQTRLTLHHAFLPGENEKNAHLGGWSRILDCLGEEFSSAGVH